MLTIKAPQNAGQNPLICNPRLKGQESFAVINKSSAFTTNVKKPSVRINNGIENIIRTGFKIEFTIPKIAPMIIIFHHSPVKVIPFTSLMAAAIETAFIIIRKNKYAMFV